MDLLLRVNAGLYTCDDCLFLALDVSPYPGADAGPACELFHTMLSEMPAVGDRIFVGLKGDPSDTIPPGGPYRSPGEVSGPSVRRCKKCFLAGRAAREARFVALEDALCGK